MTYDLIWLFGDIFGGRESEKLVKKVGSKIWGQKFAVIKSVSHDVMHFLFRQLSVSGQSHLGVFPSDGRLLTGTAHLVSERDPVRMLTQRRPMSW
jgi:hypothetical protein